MNEEIKDEETRSNETTKVKKVPNKTSRKKGNKKGSDKEGNTEVQEVAPKNENFVAPFTILYVGKHYFRGQKISEEVWSKFNKR